MAGDQSLYSLAILILRSVSDVYEFYSTSKQPEAVKVRRRLDESSKEQGLGYRPTLQKLFFDLRNLRNDLEQLAEWNIQPGAELSEAIHEFLQIIEEKLIRAPMSGEADSTSSKTPQSKLRRVFKGRWGKNLTVSRSSSRSRSATSIERPRLDTADLTSDQCGARYPRIKQLTSQYTGAIEDRLSWLLENTSIGTAEANVHDRLFSSVKTCHRASDRRFPRHAATYESLLEPHSNKTWNEMYTFCSAMESIHGQLSQRWECSCATAHRLSLFAFVPRSISDQGSVPSSILHQHSKSGSWKQNKIEMRSSDSRNETPDYDSLCEDLQLQSQRRLWYAITSRNDSVGPLRIQDLIKYYPKPPTVQERLALVLLLCYLYLHLSGGGWWPYKRTDGQPGFQIHSQSANFTITNVIAFFPFSSVGDYKVDWVAEMFNSSMPSLPVLGRTVVEIVTWSSCDDWKQLPQKLESLKDGNFPSELINNVFEVCTKWRDLIETKAIDTQYAKTIKDNERMRELFKKQVVEKLQLYLEHGFGTDLSRLFATSNFDTATVNTIPAISEQSEHEIDEQTARKASEDFRSSDSTRTGITSSKMAAESILNCDTGHLELVDGEHIKQANKWMKLLHPLQLLLEEASSQPIKVAILDTGVHFHPDVARAYEGRFESYSWIHGSFAPIQHEGDQDGHGTHLASIILRVAPNCKLYSAQIYSHRKEVQDIQSNTTVEQNIAKAIKHAVIEWEVDVISMSFGFKSQSETIRQAIEHANSRGILMLGAAGNNGALQKMRYPASDIHVLCVHAATGYGNKYGGNPTKRRSNANYSFLGVAVEGHVPYTSSTSQQKVKKSGTSQATAVAAGVVALILQIFRDKKSEIEYLVEQTVYSGTWKQITRVQGMRAIFEAMSCLRDDYDFVEPWRIHQRGKDSSATAGLIGSKITGLFYEDSHD